MKRVEYEKNLPNGLNYEETFLFDVLSLKTLLFDKTPSKKSREEYQTFFNKLCDRIGEAIFYDILGTTEYKNIKLTNADMIEAIDKINDKRASNEQIAYFDAVKFYYRRRLQERFFPRYSLAVMNPEYRFMLPIRDHHLLLAVDEVDYEKLKSEILSIRGESYPAAGSKRAVHREIALQDTESTDKKVIVDHINNNPFDARRKNLRACTPSQNMSNRFRSTKSKTGFKGVVKNASGKYSAYISVGRKCKNIGQFGTPQEASIAYNLYAKQLHGEFANVEDINADKELVESVKQQLLSKARNKRSNKCPYYGVKASGRQWKACFMKDGINHLMGYFVSPEEAARAVDTKLTELGLLDRLNFNRQESDVIKV